MIPDSTSGVRLHAVHAGNACEPALQGYLGMGIPDIGVLEVEEGADPLPALIEHLSILRPALVLTGIVSERGEVERLPALRYCESIGLCHHCECRGLDHRRAP